jgi:hypothetical protein
MLTQQKWIGVVVLLLGLVVGMYGLGHPGAAITANTITVGTMPTISPHDMMRDCGVLPVTEVDSYF